jgi:fatty-acyl-CoA synthase
VRENLIVSSPNAYAYPLLVKQLLTNSLSLYGDQEITYRGEVRYNYRDFRRRVGQLASVLEGLGVRHGATVAVMDWDSHRYLESYFAIPMMGATLFTVNVRLTPHQIAYALNDSEAKIVLLPAEALARSPRPSSSTTSLTSVNQHSLRCSPLPTRTSSIRTGTS